MGKSLSWASLSVVAVLGCSNPEQQMTPSDMGQGDSKVLVGTFEVRLVPPVPATKDSPAVPGYTAVTGRISSGPTPQLIVWEDVATQGGCTLRKPRVPFCNTPCAGGSACVENDRCQAYPSARTVGKVKLTGVKTTMGASEFTMEPIANNYQIPAGVQCPYPAFSEGDSISLSTEGGAFSPFSMTSTGIKPFALVNDTISIDPDQAVRLTWAAASAAAKSKIHVKLDISHHGGTKGVLECDGEDNGALDLPGPLLTQLLNLGVAGYPTIVVTRSATGSAVIAPGRVDLSVVSEVEKAVQIKGIVSCTDDVECPMGQKCQADLTCK